MFLYLSTALPNVLFFSVTESLPAASTSIWTSRNVFSVCPFSLNLQQCTAVLSPQLCQGLFFPDAGLLLSLMNFMRFQSAHECLLHVKVPLEEQIFL